MNRYDCIVVGAGSSGMTAAIAAKRNGLSVLLVDKSSGVGGSNVNSLVGPLMSFHAGDRQVVRGIGGEFVEKLVERKECLGYIKDPLGFCSTVTPVNAEALKKLYYEYIEKEKIDLLLHSHVDQVYMENNKVVGVSVVNKNGAIRYDAEVVIDASGDGDVAYLANVPYVLGRIKDGLTQPMTLIFVVGNVNVKAIVEYMQNNKDEFVTKEDYDYKYLGVSGFFKKVKEAKENKDLTILRDRVLLFGGVKEDEVVVNMTRVLGYNALDTKSLSIAEIEGRNQVQESFLFLKKYIPGFEQSYIVKTAQQIGIRETRHIEGLYTLTLDDVVYGKTKATSVAVGSFPVDIHSPTGANLELHNVSFDNSYDIPVEVMIPKKVDGLIVTGRAISATHEASASSRVSPTCMALGQAAGTLAYLAVKNKQKVREVDVESLQSLLVKQGQVIKK